jgi:hypothetical protein
MIENLTYNCCDMNLLQILTIIEKISMCTKLKYIHITNINNEYSEKINFNFLANFGICDIDISFTNYSDRITNFVSDDTLLILGNLGTKLDIKQIISTNFRANTIMYIKSNRFKEFVAIINNLNTNVHDLKIYFVPRIDDTYDATSNFISSSLNNFPCSLLNLNIYYGRHKFNTEYYNKIIEQLVNIKCPFGCNLLVQDYYND